MEPRDQTECLGSGALCMTSGSSPVWAAGRDRGLTDRQGADAVPPAFIHWSSGSPQTLVESTGRKRGPAGLPSTLHRARTHWATSQPCLRGLLWPQGRRHQGPGLVTQDPVRGVWCPRPGELVPSGSWCRRGGAGRDSVGDYSLPSVSRPEKQQWQTHAGCGWSGPRPASWPPQGQTWPSPTGPGDKEGPLTSILILRGPGARVGQKR